MSDRRWDYVIVGSGAGGATVARELARRKKSVIVLETGKQEKELGGFWDATRFYDRSDRILPFLPIPRKTKGGVTIWRTAMAGGSTIVSCGNGVRCLETELRQLGVDLSQEFAECEQEMRIGPIADRLLSNGSRLIQSAANDLGYEMKLMPKFIDGKACRKCGNCVLGCTHGAKWTALGSLNEAVAAGAEVSYQTRATSVVVENGRAKGVRAVAEGGAAEYRGGSVVLAAGGLGTPVLLQNSGIKEAGGGLFVDLFVNVYAKTANDKANLVYEPTMSLVNLQFHESKGFLMSPFVNHPNLTKFLEFGLGGFTFNDRRTLGIMVKTKDDAVGRVYPNGSVDKSVTAADGTRLREGAATAKEILVKAGAVSPVVSSVQGAHPGGTAAIGVVVDKNLQTKIDGLFVADASVLPATPGLPPILTIVALAKHLGKALP